jgi:diguanylate cyclase (GGDEF)-like protein
MRFLAAWLERHVGSFKVRLAAYFLLLSLLPLVGAVWAFSAVASRGETGRADARLNSALRVAVSDFQSRVEQAADTAASLARATSFQQAVAAENGKLLAQLYRETPNAAFYMGDRLVVGKPPPKLSVKRVAEVVEPDGAPMGRVVVWVPLNDQLVGELRSRSSFESGDELVLLNNGKVVGGPRGVRAASLPFERAGDIELDGDRYRALATRLAYGTPEATLAVLTPKAAIEAEAAGLRRRMLLVAIVALCVAAALAYVIGRTIVRSLKELADAAGAVAHGNFSSRVPVRGRDEFSNLGRAFNDMAEHLESRLEELAWERGRTRDAIARFGEALAATTNPYFLGPFIVESMVEATGAAGGRLIVDGEEVARSGNPEGGAEPLAIPLESEDGENGLILLTPDGPDFSDEARELAHWLAAQARTALEHASLYQRLELEAVTDGLTELPNRRQFEERLSEELARVERFGGTLALVLADLDDFKAVNDRHGHLAGDDVLRAFSDVLRDTVRDIDTAARYGGEEFALLLPNTDEVGAARLAERVRATMADRPIETFPGALVTVTASFGVAAFPASPTEGELFAAADGALYRAKRAGKNRVAVAERGDSRMPSTVRPDA